MSTRACYIFRDNGGEYAVYGHFDGYPTGAAEKVKRTMESGKTWTLPRWEADEFGAAFIAANKTDQGSFRLLASARYLDMYSNIDYVYAITNEGFNALNAKITVVAYEVDFSDISTEEQRIAAMHKLFRCPLSEFEEKAIAFESAQRVVA